MQVLYHQAFGKLHVSSAIDLSNDAIFRIMSGIVPSTIVLGGKSAGGHLALLAAGPQGRDGFKEDADHVDLSRDVSAVIGVAPVADLTERARRPGMEPLFGANPSADVVQAASPISYANRLYPPTLLIQGTAGEAVPHRMIVAIYKALEQAGAPVDLKLYAGQDHFFDREPQCGETVANSMALLMACYATATMISALPNCLT